jgi:hypothetical protein
VDVQVEGRNFFPPMLGDIRSASSSIHINQFGFRPRGRGGEVRVVRAKRLSAPSQLGQFDHTSIRPVTAGSP